MHIFTTATIPTSSDETIYLPVPRKGIIRSVKMVVNDDLSDNAGIKIYKSTTLVATAVGSSYSAGDILTATINSATTEFDVTDVMKITLVHGSTGGVAHIDIEYDIYSRTNDSASGVYTSVTTA